jgi:hypothetical protein
MARPSKPGVDWLDIHRRFANSETPHAISKALKAKGAPISRHAIEKRAKKNGWQPGVQPETHLAALATQTAEIIEKVKNDPDGASIGERRIALFSDRSPQLASEILTLIGCGFTLPDIAKLCNQPESTLRLWVKDDTKFAAEFERVRVRAVAEQINRIHKAGESDWKANAWLLERSPLTRDRFTGVASRGSGPAVQVVVNVPRGDSSPTEAADIVTIEQHAGDADLASE